MILSLIVTIYNKQDYILDCIDSILPQLINFDVELICINDGTLDDSMNILRERISKLDPEFQKKIILFDQENEGVSTARNRGIQLASGEYIGFIDSDDKILNNYIPLLVQNIEKYTPDIIDFNLITSTRKVINVRRGNDNSLDSIFRAAAWYNCARVFKKSLLDDTRFIPNIYYEDLAFFPILYVKAKKIFHIDKPLYWYRTNENGITMTSNETANLKTILSLETVFLHFLNLYRESMNSYFAIAALQTYFLLCVNASRRLGYKESIYYLKKYRKEIMDLNLRNDSMSSKLSFFYLHGKKYLSIYYIYCVFKHKK